MYLQQTQCTSRRLTAQLCDSNKEVHLLVSVKERYKRMDICGYNRQFNITHRDNAEKNTIEAIGIMRKIRIELTLNLNLT